MDNLNRMFERAKFVSNSYNGSETDAESKLPKMVFVNTLDDVKKDRSWFSLIEMGSSWSTTKASIRWLYDHLTIFNRPINSSQPILVT